MTRAKVQLTEITSLHWNKDSRRLKFQAIYDTSTDENSRFTKATPSGSFEMQVDNPAALAQFELGKYYYVDFTPAQQ